MATFDVGLWSSYELDQAVGTDAVDQAKSYIKNAINSYSEHWVYVTIEGVKGIPQEKVHGSFNTTYSACGPPSPDAYYWEDLGDWWEAELRCNSSITDRDCHLLLTSYDSQAGVCYDNYASVAEGGTQIANLPSPTSLWGSDSSGPFDSMQTALHELGHALTYGSEDGFDEHLIGEDEYHDGVYHRTPMWANSSTNHCGDSSGTANYGNWTMQFGECAESKMRH